MVIGKNKNVRYLSFNRTIVELKFWNKQIPAENKKTFNRTIVELKSLLPMHDAKLKPLLIVP